MNLKNEFHGNFNLRMQLKYYFFNFIEIFNLELCKTILIINVIQKNNCESNYNCFDLNIIEM